MARLTAEERHFIATEFAQAKIDLEASFQGAGTINEMRGLFGKLDMLDAIVTKLAPTPVADHTDV